MRYKTKKYIKKSILYVFNTSVIIVLYTIAAHKFYLPAFFEFYTGNIVREKTLVYYEKYSGSSVESGEIDYMNLVDYVTREPNYLYIKDILGAIEPSSKQTLPLQIKEDVTSISTFPALIEWIKNPYSKYASIYQFESIRFIDGFGSIDDYLVLDKANKVLFAKGKINVNDLETVENSEVNYKKGIVYVPVKHNGSQIGKLIVDTGGLFQFNLNFENTGLDVSYFLLQVNDNLNGKIINKHISDPGFQKWIRDNNYSGFYSGIHDGHRFLLKNYGHQNLVIIYKAESILFYVSKFILYIIGILTIASFYFFIQRGYFREFFKKKKNSEIEELLKKSNEMAMEYASMSLKLQNSFYQLKNQEVDRLRIISEHLGFLHQSVYQGMDNENHELKSLD
ncbi:MAG: hypothetical protein OEV78_03080 [Spirochaetia bacterium]|nr:hypothetical protein [Spirochaetia bacterium]